MPLTRSFCFALSLLSALPLAASQRKRTVAPLPPVTVSGVISDSTGTPVVGAIVTSGTVASNRNGTGKDGAYSLSLPANRPAPLTVTDFAFDPQTFTVTPTGTTTTFNITLTSAHPTITVKMTNGDSHSLDFPSSQFAYLIPLSGYIRNDTGNFCKPDGTPFAPAKTDIARIVGPGTPVTFGPCCTIGPTVSVSVEMKSGEKTTAYFNDSCSGYEVDFVGRERTTSLWQYLRFADIAEIDFP